jgi:hypothetical protein
MLRKNLIFARVAFAGFQTRPEALPHSRNRRKADLQPTKITVVLRT